MDFEKINTFFSGNAVALLIILLGASLCVLKHEEAGKATIAGGLTHLQSK